MDDGTKQRYQQGHLNIFQAIVQRLNSLGTTEAAVGFLPEIHLLQDATFTVVVHGRSSSQLFNRDEIIQASENLTLGVRANIAALAASGSAFMRLPPPPGQSVSDPALLESLKETLHTHYVSIYLEVVKNSKVIRQVISGSLMLIAGQPLIVTAGHVIEEIKVALAQGFKIKRQYILDQYAPLPARTMPPIPFDWQTAEPWSVYRNGADYGALKVDQLLLRNLQAGGKVFLSERHWDVPSEAYAQFYVLLGTKAPDSVATETSLRTSTAMVFLNSLGEQPSEFLETPSVDTFWGKVTGDVGTIVGMSGGVVFGVDVRDDARNYFAAAIQSGWIRSEGLIRAPRIRPFAKMLAERRRKR